MLIYTYPMCADAPAQANNSATERVKVPLGNCFDNLGFDEDCGCLSKYCQLYKDTDTFTTQLYLASGLQTLIRIDIYDLNSVLVGTIAYGVGSNTKSIWNEYGVQSTTLIDMGAIHTEAGVDCFYLKYVYTSESYESAPYCLVGCEEKSILISSTYNTIDCNNRVWNYNILYDEDGNNIVPFSNEIRLKGVVDFNSVGIENTYEEADTSISVRRIHTKSTRTNQFDLRIWRTAEWQVRNLSSILGGTNLTIKDDTGTSQYECKSGFEKGNMGSDWFPSIQLQQVCSLFNKNC